MPLLQHTVFLMKLNLVLLCLINISGVMVGIELKISQFVCMSSK